MDALVAAELDQGIVAPKGVHLHGMHVRVQADGSHDPKCSLVQLWSGKLTVTLFRKLTSSRCPARP